MLVQTCEAEQRSALRSERASAEVGPTHGVHEVLGVGGDDENVAVGREVRLKPHDGLEIQVVRGLVEEKEMGADSEGLGEGDTHPPSSRHVLGGLGHHLGSETESVKDGTGLGLESRGVELLELLVLELEAKIVDDIGNRHLLDLLLDTGGLVAGGLDNVVEGGNVGRLDLSLDEVDL